MAEEMGLPQGAHIKNTRHHKITDGGKAEISILPPIHEAKKGIYLTPGLSGLLE